MPWVPIAESGLRWTFADNGGGQTFIHESIVHGNAGGGGEVPPGFANWVIDAQDSEGANELRLRITRLVYADGEGLALSNFVWVDPEGAEHLIENEDSSGATFLPEQFEAEIGEGAPIYYTGAAQETPAEIYQFLVEAWVDGPEPPAGGCDEIGPVTRANVSAYQRTRTHYSRVHRGERRCLVANFNGAIPLSRSIVSATWRTYANNVAILSSPRINGREVEIDLIAGYGGRAWIKLEARLDNGEQYMQTFVVEVQDAPWYPGEVLPANGPETLTVAV